MKQESLPGDVGSVKPKPPTLEMVKEEALRIGLSEIEAEKFYSYFESNGWMVGRVKMKSWTAALNNWRLRSHQGKPREEARRERTVYEITKIIEAKRKIADQILFANSSETANGRKWSSELARARFRKLVSEIKELVEKLAGM